jgi:hypothetical protein
MEFSATRDSTGTPRVERTVSRTCDHQQPLFDVMKKEEIYVEQPVEARPAFLGRLSWGAVFAGVLMTFVTALMLSLLGIGVGASSIDPLKGQQPVKGLAIGTLVWLVATALISSLCGAWVAGRSAGALRRGDGAIHGLVTWGVTTICAGLLTTTTLGALLGGVTTLLGKTVSAAAKTGAAAADQSGINWDVIKQDIQEKFPQTKVVLSPTGPTNEQTQTDEQRARQNPKVVIALAKMFAKGGAAKAPDDRAEVVNVLVSEQNMVREDAEHQVDDWDQKFQQTKTETEQKVRKAGDVAARGVSRAALGSFALMVLCALAAMAGGRAGEASAFRRTKTVAVIP